MSTLPLISVIVPVYNVEDYLAACINSISTQSYSNLEILLIDDGSTDRSGDMCDSLALSDSRIQVLHKTNGGLSDARNHGIDIATGSFIVFVDSDDTISPDAISTLYSLAAEHNADIAMASFHTRRNNSGTTVAMTGIDAAKSMLYQDTIDASACGKLFSINLFKKARFTKGIFYEDLDFMMKVVPSISKAVWIDRPIYHYTMRPANFNMFVLLVCNGYSHSLHADRCWNNIKSLRFGSLFNRHVRLKNKLGILASLPGRRFFSVIIRIYNKL